jgi:hypothetical protein
MERKEREREKVGLKLLSQLMEMSKHFSNLNFNKPISSFFFIIAILYVALSLNEKVKVGEAKGKDKLTIRDIMMRFKCGKMQVYNTLKQKDKTMNEWLQGNGQLKRTTKATRQCRTGS